ncbi:MAG: hypothetical protein ACLFVJ_20180 [Persicimonas sp.]
MRRMLSSFVLCASLIAAAADTAEAVPRMALTAGSPCSPCHVNQQGGGMRSMIGWSSMADVGMVNYEQMGVDWFSEMYSNEVVEGWASVGLDMRFQMARLGRPVGEFGEDGQINIIEPDRRIIPMQIQPHALVDLTDYVRLHGSYAAGPNTFDGELCDTPFAGQSCYVAEAIFEPDAPWPAVRAGMFQPSMGIRHDDHTMLIRQDASRPRRALIPANYAELGAEASYQPLYWLRMEAGAFRAANLAEAIGQPEVVSTNDVAYLGRVSFLPRVEFGEDWDLSAMIGGSAYGAGDFHMQNLFAGIGMLDFASLIVEGAHFARGSAAEGINVASILSIEARKWLVVEGRLERGWASNDDGDFTTDAAVVGVQFVPMPYVKLRPEYRYLTTDDYAMGQYTAQLHIFY